MIAKLKQWLRNAAEPKPAWQVPVRLLTRQKVGMFTRRAGATVWVPFGKAIAMDRDGRAELQLASINTETGKVSDPLAPPQRPDTHRGLRW